MRNEQSVNNGTSVYMCYIITLKRKTKLCRDVLLKLFTILSFYHFLLNVYQVCQCLVLQGADAPEEEEEEDLVVRCKYDHKQSDIQEIRLKT